MISNLGHTKNYKARKKIFKARKFFFRRRSFTLLVVNLFCLLATFAGSLPASAQSRHWKTIHAGNRAFLRHEYDKAEVAYRKVLSKDSTDARAHFNLGDTYLAKRDAGQALAHFQKAARYEKNKVVKAMAYHNEGYIHHAAAMGSTQESERQQLLRQAIEEYKEALRLNPADNDTRYNLALCKKLLKDSPNQNQQQQQQQKQQQKDKDKQQQQQQKPQDQTQQPEQDKQQPPKEQKSTPQDEQLLNLSKQAEQRAKQKVDEAMRRPRRRSLQKNW
ncbi:MAG: tetratricopeptide repeat protein [Alloprevotella sp.]